MTQAQGSSTHRQLLARVDALRQSLLGAGLDIPDPFERGNDEHLEHLAGQLLEQFRRHDDVEAYVALVELTQDRLSEVAGGVTRRLALMIDPDDLVAAFMARLFTDVRKPGTRGPVRRFLALAYTMMRFDALNQLRLMRRSRERGIRFEEREAVRRKPRDPAQVAEVREGSAGLARLGTLLLMVVGRCFHDLRTRDRRILICREIEGLTYDEIAAAMDVPRPQVGMILKRARTRLAERIHGALPDTIEPRRPAIPPLPSTLGRPLPCSHVQVRVKSRVALPTASTPRVVAVPTSRTRTTPEIV